MCPTFCKVCYYELEKQDYGWLTHPNGRSVRVDSYIPNFEFYMTSGIRASKNLKFTKPMQVVMCYLNIEDNTFKMTNVEQYDRQDKHFNNNKS